MADSRRGKKLTEEHRLAQLAVRAAFIRQYIELWPLLDPSRLDATGAAWVRTVMEEIRQFREESAQLAERYYRDFRMAEAPTDALTTPVPVIRRSSTGGRSRRPRQPGRAIPDAATFDENDMLIFNDDAATTGLIVTGPVNIKSKISRGKTVEQAVNEALAESTGAATRSVLTGGRETHLKLVQADPAALDWMRVTDGDPCAFCAMLASRGPVYRSFQSATTVVNPKTDKPTRRNYGEAYHDHCGCTAEAVYSSTQMWPGRNKEFYDLWKETTKGLSGKKAINAFRREYQRRIREKKNDQQKEAG